MGRAARTVSSVNGMSLSSGGTVTLTERGCSALSDRSGRGIDGTNALGGTDQECRKLVGRREYIGGLVSTFSGGGSMVRRAANSTRG